VRLDALFRTLFLVYCVEAGLFLILAPWTDSWDRIALQLPVAVLRGLLAATWFRGLMTGFGVVHLLWVAHDAELSWRKPRPATPPSDVEPAPAPRGQ
jgi:hypothetical protein